MLKLTYLSIKGCNRKFEFKKISNHEKGFMLILMVLVMGSILPILIAFAASYFINQSKQNISVKVSLNYHNLQTKIQMLLSSINECKFNLDPQYFGSSLAQLATLSTAGNIRVGLPALGGNPSQILISNTVNFADIKAERIFFSTPVQVNPPDTDYVSELNLVLRDRSSFSILHTIRIPFYFMTDAAGTITDCFATAYPDTNVAGRIPTMEDLICKQIDSSTSLYIPSERSCL